MQRYKSGQVRMGDLFKKIYYRLGCVEKNRNICEFTKIWKLKYKIISPNFLKALFI